MALSYQKTIQAIQQRIEYDANKNPLYIGQAVRGVATSSAGWVVRKMTYDVNHSLIGYQTAMGDWDSRTTLTYS